MLRKVHYFFQLDVVGIVFRHFPENSEAITYFYISSFKIDIVLDDKCLKFPFQNEVNV